MRFVRPGVGLLLAGGHSFNITRAVEFVYEAILRRAGWWGSVDYVGVGGANGQ